MIRYLLLLALTLLPFAASAQTGKPVRLVVPFTAGGAYDIIARILGQKIAPALGQPVIENRAGAGGIIGAEVVAKAAPDGDTLLMAGQSSVTIAPWLFDKLGYDPETELAPVTYLADTPMVLMAASSFPANSFAEFIDQARARPGALNYASFGNGGTSHLIMELLMKIAHVDLVHVPYRGAGPALIDVMSGTVSVSFSSVASAKSYLDDKRLKPFAVASAQRTVHLPAVPTLGELGVNGAAVPVWMGIMTTHGTPAAKIARLDEELRKALASDEVKQQMSFLGADIVGHGPAPFALMLKDDRERWRQLIAGANIKVN